MNEDERAGELQKQHGEGKGVGREKRQGFLTIQGVRALGSCKICKSSDKIEIIVYTH